MSDRLRISVRGQGPELVLLHGWAMNSGIWGGLVDLLATDFRVHLVDLPGHGVNQHIALSPDLNEVTELIMSELPAAIWMGWSLGGLVALNAAMLRPHSVQKTILIAATPCFSAKTDWDCGVGENQQQAFANGLGHDLVGTLDQFYVQTFGTAGVEEALHRLGRSVCADNVPTLSTMHTGLDLLYRYDLRAGLAHCRVPALYIGGTRDRTIQPKTFERAAALMPKASSCLIRGASHAPFISHQERFLDLIKGFVMQEHMLEQQRS